MNNTLVLYHDKCMDGFASAWAYHTLHKHLDGYDSAVTYQPISYGERVTTDLEGWDVVVLDFSFSPNEVKALCRKAKSVTVIDHHKDAVEKLQGNLFPVNFTLYADTGRSGALLTWDYYSKEVMTPLAIKLISDRDTWQFYYATSKAFHAYISMQPLFFEVWDAFMLDPDQAVLSGFLLLNKEQELVRQTTSSATYGLIYYQKEGEDEVRSVDCMVCNSLMSLASEAGHKLLKDYDVPLALLFQVIDNTIKFSYRSKPSFDCAELARLKGGGGHPQAAGFILPLEEGFHFITTILDSYNSKAIQESEGY